MSRSKGESFISIDISNPRYFGEMLQGFQNAAANYDWVCEESFFSSGNNKVIACKGPKENHIAVHERFKKMLSVLKTAAMLTKYDISRAKPSSGKRRRSKSTGKRSRNRSKRQKSKGRRSRRRGPSYGFKKSRVALLLLNYLE